MPYGMSHSADRFSRFPFLTIVPLGSTVPWFDLRTQPVVRFQQLHSFTYSSLLTHLKQSILAIIALRHCVWTSMKIADWQTSWIANWHIP